MTFERPEPNLRHFAPGDDRAQRPVAEAGLEAMAQWNLLRPVRWWTWPRRYYSYRREVRSESDVLDQLELTPCWTARRAAARVELYARKPYDAVVLRQDGVQVRALRRLY